MHRRRRCIQSANFFFFSVIVIEEEDRPENGVAVEFVSFLASLSLIPSYDQRVREPGKWRLAAAGEGGGEEEQFLTLSVYHWFWDLIKCRLPIQFSDSSLDPTFVSESESGARKNIPSSRRRPSSQILHPLNSYYRKKGIEWNVGEEYVMM